MLEYGQCHYAYPNRSTIAGICSKPAPAPRSSALRRIDIGHPISAGRPSLVALGLIATAFAIATYGAIHLANAFSNGTQLWPGPGLLAGLLLVSPRPHRTWHAGTYLLSAGLAYWLYGYAPGAALARSMVAIVEALALLWLLGGNRAWVEGREDRLVLWLKFIGVGVVSIPLLGALPGGWLISVDRGIDFPSGFRIWYTAHAVSMCVMVPLLLRLQRQQIDRLIAQKRVVETIVWLVTFTTIAGIMLTQNVALPLFLLMPFLIMIVFRSGFVGLVLAVGILALLATFTLYTNQGPFLAMTPGTEWWGADSLSQLFIMLVFGTMVLIAALLEERRGHEAALEASNRELARMATTDALTGLPNRRWFDTEIAQAWARARHESVSVTLLVIDVDHFKHYNDHYGHAAGDICLRNVAAILQSEARRTEQLCARYGGEEFVVLLSGVSADEARRVGNRLCLAVKDAALSHAASDFGVVTVSIGAATVQPGNRENGDLFRLSDSALYDAKRRGRNCTVSI